MPYSGIYEIIVPDRTIGLNPMVSCESMHNKKMKGSLGHEHYNPFGFFKSRMSFLGLFSKLGMICQEVSMAVKNLYKYRIKKAKW